MRTISTTIAALTKLQGMAPLPTPPYDMKLCGIQMPRVGLAVESMRHHMTDEGWQLFVALQHAGYHLAGHNLTTWMQETSGTRERIPVGHVDMTDVARVLKVLVPSTVVMQDKREWDVRSGDFREPKARFTNIEALRDHPSIFKLTVLKDSHQRPPYHRESAEEIGCHAWVVYYHPHIVQHLAPYVRPQHLVRTYHSVDSFLLPPYTPRGRDRCLLSGAISTAYPLRTLLVRKRAWLPQIDYLQHPGYHRQGCCTPRFLGTLCSYKVAICTSSVYGYALRKIIEATAAGCHVLTDLPADEVLPNIDGNLTRITPTSNFREVGGHVAHLIAHYSPERQEHFANAARKFYDYRAVGRRLSDDIEHLRVNYR